MSDLALAFATTYRQIGATYQAKESSYTENVVQEVEVMMDEATRDLLLASERALYSDWMTPEEDEAWKDL